MNKNLMKSPLLLLAAVTGLSGCVAPLWIGGAVVGGTVATATDRRSTGALVNDEIIEKRVYLEITQAFPRTAQHHITVTSYNGVVLLTGQVDSEETMNIAEKKAVSSLDIRRVLNELSVRENISIMQRMSDSSTATKVRSRILTNENVTLNQMKVVVEDGVVYLMGVVTPEEKLVAENLAATTSGVKKVVSLFEIMNQERIDQMMKDREHSKLLQSKETQN